MCVAYCRVSHRAKSLRFGAKIADSISLVAGKRAFLCPLAGKRHGTRSVLFFLAGKAT
jgi:hypothetical protein